MSHATILLSAQQHLATLGYPGSPIKTAEVRKISASMFKTLPDKTIDAVLTDCEVLLEQRDWALGVIAYDWAFRVKKQYSEETFFVFEQWLYRYVKDWSDCDDFCTHAFGELVAQYNPLFSRVLRWTESDNFAVRRAAAVVLIYPIYKQRSKRIDALMVADRLMTDEHDLVQKGYGWMLKVLSQQEPETVIDYLQQHHQIMPRTAFRYALEKLSPSVKQQLMAL